MRLLITILVSHKSFTDIDFYLQDIFKLGSQLWAWLIIEWMIRVQKKLRKSLESGVKYPRKEINKKKSYLL